MLKDSSIPVCQLLPFTKSGIYQLTVENQLWFQRVTWLFIKLLNSLVVCFCSKDSPLVTHCYSRLLHSILHAIEQGQYSTSTSSAVNQRNMLRIGECLYSRNVTFIRANKY